ncbi:MAG TPA: hypothetical protein VJ206_03000 [bacterium]|nr:hypothetical protein [bacterium]
MAHPLTAVEFDVPQQSGAVLCVPPARTFLALARENGERLDAADVHLAGVGLREVRARMRRAVHASAASYAAEVGLQFAAGWSGSGPLIGTGHQPFLFHPGIWTKQLLVARFGGQATALNMPVDCDAAEDVGADVPVLGDGLRIVRETLIRAEADVPYEALPAPAPAAWQAFLDRVDGDLQTLPHHTVLEIFSAFSARTARLEAPDLGAFLTLARRIHEGPRPYAEVPVSRLTQTAGFRLFVTHILRDAARFAASYNRHLNEYRDRYNVRSAAQPFPNLTRDGPRTELPFWIIREGRRRPVFVEDEADRVRLWAGEEAVAEVPLRGEPAGLDTVDIRPKALALTAFKRVCVVDLFVHGVGGGRYDRVTDAVLRDFFNLTPPGYAVVTSTLHLPLNEFDPTEERGGLQRGLLELRHNPERILTSPEPEQRQWIEEKWELIRRLGDPSLSRRERREATHRIRDLNERLARALAGAQASIEKRLAALAEISEASAAATQRGYPFCFFPPAAVEVLVDRIMGDGADA